MIVVPFTVGHRAGHADRAVRERRRSRTRPSGRSTPRSSRRASGPRKPAPSRVRCRAPCGRRSPASSTGSTSVGAPASMLRRDHVIDRQLQLRRRAPCACAMIVARRVELVVFDQRLADRLALRLEERVGHRAADEQPVDAAEQVLDDLDLVRDLGAAEDGDERPLGIAERRGRDSCSSFSISSPAAGLRHHGATIASTDACARCAAPKASFDVDVGERGERLREAGVVLLLLRVEAQVLEQHDARPSSTCATAALGGAPMQSSANADGAPEQLADAIGHRPQAHTPASACPSAGRGARPGSRARPLERVLDGRQRRA